MLAMWGGETDQRLRPAMAKQGRPSAAIARIRCGKKYRQTHVIELAERLSEWRTLNVEYYRNYQKLYHRDRRAVCAPRYVAPFRLSADPRPFCNGNIQTRRPVRAGLHQ